MNKYQKWFIVSIVFLAAAFVMPIYVLYNALTTTLQTAVNVLPDYSSNNPSTQNPASFLQAQQAAQLQLLIVVIGIEALLIGCFVVTLLYAIRCRDQCRTYPVLGQSSEKK